MQMPRDDEIRRTDSSRFGKIYTYPARPALAFVWTGRRITAGVITPYFDSLLVKSNRPRADP